MITLKIRDIVVALWSAAMAGACFGFYLGFMVRRWIHEWREQP